MKKKLKKNKKYSSNVVRYFSSEYTNIYLGQMIGDWYVAACYNKCRR